ncbi:MAG: glutamate mutase L, partial [Firmicutes bacterium]|nr:glutamate mutase L [Bacillota bacterium]
VDHLAEHTDEVPTSEEWERLDYALASMAIDTAVERHAGHLEEIYTVMGSTYMQTGKDLSNIRQVVVTGGSLIHTKRTDEIAAHALYNPDKPMSLRPGRANILVDRHYILASMGLLSEHYPTAALHIMKKELENMGEQIADASAAAVPGSGFVPVMDFADCHSGHHPED